MPDVPKSSSDNSNTADDANLQGYQDDLDTSKQDQAINEATENPYRETPATRSEFAQGLRDTAIDEGDLNQEPSKSDPEPPLADPEDYREDIEDRDEDDKDRDSSEPWH